MARLHRLPSEDSDDGIQALEAAPAHLRPDPKDLVPIVVLDSDDEYGILTISNVAPHVKRTRSASQDPLASKRKRSRGPANPSTAAGPLRAPGEVDPSEVTDDPGVRILPKADYLVPIVQEIIPDICTKWARENIERLMAEDQGKSSAPGQDAVDEVINMALEMDSYPKEGAVAAAVDEEVPDYDDPNYHKGLRIGPGYHNQATATLESAFPTIPIGHIRSVWMSNGCQLVPVYHVLHRQSMSADKPYNELKKKRSGKGKQRADPDEEEAEAAAMNDMDGLLEGRKEVAYLRGLMAKALEKEQAELSAEAQRKEAEEDLARRRAAAVERGDGVECGCCFDTESPDDTVTCPEGHAFCHSCVRLHAETKLGDQITDIRCMDVSGCIELFLDSTLAVVLTEKTMSLYHRLKQMKELEQADIEGLESCPFCPFAMVIENELEKLFHCQNSDCRKVTCRQCRRPNHIPKRCEEVEADAKLDKRHTVEEAMSEALMRKCPKCAKPYIKDLGCNKILCQGCSTVSCYICQKAIPEGYAHFNQQPAAHGQKADGRCPLWDPKEHEMDAERIIRARDAAAERTLAAAAREGVQLNADDLRVDGPEIRHAIVPPIPAAALPMQRFGADLNALNALHALGEQLGAAGRLNYAAAALNAGLGRYGLDQIPPPRPAAAPLGQAQAAAAHAHRAALVARGFEVLAHADQIAARNRAQPIVAPDLGARARVAAVAVAGMPPAPGIAGPGRGKGRVQHNAAPGVAPVDIFGAPPGPAAVGVPRGPPLPHPGRPAAAVYRHGHLAQREEAIQAAARAEAPEIIRIIRQQHEQIRENRRRDIHRGGGGR